MKKEADNERKQTEDFYRCAKSQGCTGSRQQNADPIWLHQNGMWEYIKDEGESTKPMLRTWINCNAIFFKNGQISKLFDKPKTDELNVSAS